MQYTLLQYTLLPPNNVSWQFTAMFSKYTLPATIQYTLVTLSQENLLQYTYNIYYQTFQQTLDDLSSMQYSDL